MDLPKSPILQGSGSGRGREPVGRGLSQLAAVRCRSSGDPVFPDQGSLPEPPPFQRQQNRLQAIRTLSKTLSDEIPSFMALRIKIHGQPGSEDLQAVKDFARENQAALTAQQITLFSQLLEQMSAEYAVSPSDALAKLLAADRLRHPALSGPAEALAVSSSALRKGTVLFPEKIPIRSGTWQTCFWPFGAV